MSILLFVSKICIPAVMAYIILYGILHKVPVYSAFLTGVKQGFDIVIDITPTLIGLLVAVGVFRASGGLDMLGRLFLPVARLFGLNPELFPLAIVRMLSSSAATGMTLDIFKTYGPDSAIGNIVSVMMSSTETIFYTISVYFLSVKITRTRWTLAGALTASTVGLIASVIIGSMM